LRIDIVACSSLRALHRDRQQTARGAPFSTGCYGGLFRGGYVGVQGEATIAGGGARYGGQFEASGGTTNYGVFSTAIGSGYAGYFVGNVGVAGALSKSAGSFKIDHPLDPEHKYLSHSFVESPDMMNVYNGIAVLDERGEATVDLPEWFETLNRDFRYQLTPIGARADVWVAREIADNRFAIAGDVPGLKVSWQVTGIRQDPYARAHPILVEESKRPEEQGLYLHPDAYGLPDTRGIEHNRDPGHARPSDVSALPSTKAIKPIAIPAAGSRASVRSVPAIRSDPSRRKPTSGVPR
jgi:hypothetical protein